MQYVKESTRGTLIFPPNIPNKRGMKDTYALLTVLGLVFIVCCLITEGLFVNLISSCSVVITCMIIGELIIRICASFEEIKYLHSRYEDNVIRLIHDVFSFPWSFIISMIMSFFILLSLSLIFNKNPFYMSFGDNWLVIVHLFVSMYLLTHILKFERSPLNTAVQINNFDGLDYGSGMAHSMFHGYLRLVLPDSGIENDKGLREFQKDYESRNGISFEVYKLFILIPMSQHCPPRLNSEFSPSIEESKGLESKEIDRAGVQKRNYKNPVYKINTQSGHKKYVSAEYATPVKTLHEIMKQNTLKGDFYNKYRKEILLNFYMTLRDLIKQDPDCCDLCEIIYYDDKNDKGEFLDVGGIILNRLERIKKNL